MTIASLKGTALTVAEARREFDAQTAYLNTATCGLPPRQSWQAFEAAQLSWRSGRPDPDVYDLAIAGARSRFAELVGVDSSAVAVGGQVSVFAGLVAASLPAGSEVLTAAGDFTSIVFPFYAQAGRGISVREVPLHAIAENITERTTLVSVSAVQSADGRIADLDAIVAACDATGTRILLDTTQAAGWFPIDAGRFAYTVTGGYKWLLAPRGTTFFTIQPELVEALVPLNAGWFAGEQPWSSVYGGPLRLAADARRFDVAPAWFSWVGAEPALDLIQRVGISALHANNVALANRLLTGIGLPPVDSAIVSLAVDDEGRRQLHDAEVMTATRAGRMRLSFHVSTSEDDVDRAIKALRGHVVP